jgi:hypothetical protein
MGPCDGKVTVPDEITSMKILYVPEPVDERWESISWIFTINKPLTLTLFYST